MTHTRALPILAGLTALALLASPCAAQQDAPAQTKSSIVYKTVNGTEILADVYLPPESEKPQPVLVWFHGGALIVGSRTQVPRNLLEFCAREQVILVSPDYRLAPEVKLPEIVTDVIDFFRWLRAEGPKRLNADTSRVVVSGGSAGGYLSLLSGTIIDPEPTAILSYWGYGDFGADWTSTPSVNHGPKLMTDVLALAFAAVGGDVLTNTDNAAVQKARGDFYRMHRQEGTWGEVVTGIKANAQKDVLENYSPARRITRDYPPTLMIHGEADTDVPYSAATQLKQAFEKAGVEHQLITVPNAEHGLRGGDPKLIADAHARALQFLREKLKLTAPEASK